MKRGKSNSHLLKLNRNIYGQKQATHVWYQYLAKKLQSIGFKKSQVDKCLFTRGKVLYILYTDNSVMIEPNKEEFRQAIEDIKSVGL